MTPGSAESVASSVFVITGNAWRRPAFAMFAVGWGANHFTALLPIYRRVLEIPDTTLTAIFGIYLLGVAPALLLGGPISDRYGRRPVVLLGVVLALGGSLVLITGTRNALGVPALYVGRLLTGLAAGAAFAAGSAWVKELSIEGGGARRAAISLSAGFGMGPLVGGLLAQWGAAPMVLPYIVHLLLAAVALALVPGTVETVNDSAKRESLWRQLKVPSALAPRFRRVVVPMAPWVFGAATISFAVLPARAGQLSGLSVVFAGVVAAITLAMGIAVQPLARRIGYDDPARGAMAGLGAVALGCVIGAIAAAAASPLLVLAAAAGLGAGYGFCLVSGLREAERLAAPGELAGLVAVYYVLAYLGFCGPYGLALLAPVVGYPAGLLIAAGLASATLIWIATQVRQDSKAVPAATPAIPGR